MQKISIPLPLLGAKNVRDLGGYKTETGLVTKSHSLLRGGDALHNLTNEDCSLLLKIWKKLSNIFIPFIIRWKII